MKIVRLRTGAKCITLPSDGVIYIDPDVAPEEVFGVILMSLPDAHPDAIQHWIEAAMPTTTPLSTYKPNRAARRRAEREQRKSGSHRTAKTVGRTGMRLTSMAAAAALTAVVLPMVQNPGPAPVSAAEAWENEVFNRVETGSAWECIGTDSSDLVATCTTPDGTQMHAEAWVGPNSLTFIFTYRDPGTGLQHRNTLKVFSSEGAVRAWVSSRPTENGLMPNLTVGGRWVMYGSDADRLKRWAERLGDQVVLPADVAAAAFEMGLLPSPQHRREMARVPEVVRQTAARIVVGDETMPIETIPPIPGGGGVFPSPGETKPPTVPSGPISVDPAPPAPPPLPTPTPTDPTPTDPPAADPIPAPIPTPTDPPAGDPPGDGPTTGDPTPTPTPTDPPPGDGPTTGDPGDGPTTGDPTTGNPVPNPPTSTPGATEPPEDSTGGNTPHNPEGDGPGQDDEQTPGAPVNHDPGDCGEGVEPGQGSGQPGKDPLTDPVEVPEDETTPAFEATARPKATPIFDQLVVDMALNRSQAPEHARGRPFQERRTGAAA